MWLHGLQMFLDVALNPMEWSETMSFVFYTPNYLCEVIFDLLCACTGSRYSLTWP